jgi:N-acetylglucosamine-6-phosphate deacetylase
MKIHARRALLDDGLAADVVIEIADGRIASVRVGVGAEDAWSVDLVAPGFIDLQINGGFGVEVDAGGAAVATLAQQLPRHGVTAFLPTLVTLQAGAYRRAIAAFTAARASSGSGARPLGLHLEGPFLSPDAAGAHERAWIESADERLFDNLTRSDAVAMMTLAPERNGAIERISRLVAKGIVVSVGHTRATYEECMRAFDAGATMVTHLYNAMSPLGHRAPGVVGAALLDDRVTCGLIVDGVHAHAAAMRIALRAKTPSRIALVTDAMAAAGMGPGTYALAGKSVTVDTTSARLADGTLAGSILTMDAAVQNAVALHVSVEDSLRMASSVPARVLGLSSKGRIDVGADADLVLLDDELRVRATIVAGQIAFSAHDSPHSPHNSRIS